MKEGQALVERRVAPKRTTALSRASFSSGGCQKSSSPSGDYECGVCKRRFASVSNGVHHYNEHFSRAECKVCGRWLLRAEWPLHIAVFHKFKRHDCVYCGKKFDTSSAQHKHVTSKHTGPHYRCTKCKHRYSLFKNFKMHRCVVDRQKIRDLKAVQFQHPSEESVPPAPKDQDRGRTPPPTGPPPISAVSPRSAEYTASS